MPLPSSDPSRQLRHRRAIRVDAFARGDGLWEVDVHISDVKTRETRSPAGVRAAGEPIHDLLLRLVVDTQFNIIESGAESLSTPYPGHCEQHGDAYGQLAGMNLLRGFKRGVREKLGGTAGCTHLTELADVLPTAVIQAFAGEVINTQGDGDTAPFQLDRCHALKTDGEVVRLHYPRWFRQVNTSKLAHNRAPMTQAAPQGEPPKADSAPFISS